MQFRGTEVPRLRTTATCAARYAIARPTSSLRRWRELLKERGRAAAEATSTCSTTDSGKTATETVGWRAELPLGTSRLP